MATVGGYLVMLIWMWKAGRKCLDYRFPPLVACKLIAGGGLGMAACWFLPEFGPRLLTITARTSLCLVVYCGFLYLSEEEFRTLGRLAMGYLGKRYAQNSPLSPP